MTRVRTREWSSTDYYAVLGVDPLATPAEIDSHYRDLAKELHPDRNADLDDQERFRTGRDRIRQLDFGRLVG